MTMNKMQFETTLTFGEPITFLQLLHERRKSMGEFYFFDRSMAAGTVVFWPGRDRYGLSDLHSIYVISSIGIIPTFAYQPIAENFLTQ